MTAAPGDRGSGPGRACSRVFPARADQVALARAFAREMLAGCPAADDLVLACSELASNSVRHSASARPGGEFTVRLEVRGDDWAWIEVEDEGGPWERKKRSGEGQYHGLGIVDAVADYWDIREDDTSRTVCVRIDWPSGA
ncbi:MAG: ATP-binding protein [Actinomycetota bacterium]|nr:ATP-binding protein [Actinomycetota bacterium]